jgi:hypothetical protein
MRHHVFAVELYSRTLHGSDLLDRLRDISNTDRLLSLFPPDLHFDAATFLVTDPHIEKDDRVLTLWMCACASECARVRLIVCYLTQIGLCMCMCIWAYLEVRALHWHRTTHAWRRSSWDGR